jgi:hypothetical protein
MPTIIDSLIVQLGFDTTGVAEGERRVTESLHKLDNQATRSAQNIESSAGKSLKSYLDRFDAHFATINKNLVVLGSQGRRSGAEVAAGANIAAEGLANITASGMAAYAAVKSVQGLIQSMSGSASYGAGIGRMAPEIGSSSRFVQDFANAAKIAVNADPAAVTADLRSLSTDLEAWHRRGIMAGRLREVMIGGVDLSSDDTVESAMRKIEANLHAMSTTEAAMRAQLYGLTVDTGRFARQGPTAVNAAMAGVDQRHLTADQIYWLDRLQRSINQSDSAYSHLWDVIVSDFSKGGLAPALEGFSSLADHLSQDKDKLAIVETALEAVAAVAGVTVVTAVGKLVVAVNSLWATPLFRLLASGSFWRFFGPIGAFVAAMWPSAAGNQSEVDAD